MEINPIKKILVANRGEIALRILKTLQKMQINSVAIYDIREKNTPYVTFADETYQLDSGPLSENFLNSEKIIEIALQTKCQAIHPGYGFLSENPDFAALCRRKGLVFIGPPARVISSLANKKHAAEIAKGIGVPTIPQIKGDIDHIQSSVPDNFFPCLVKAAYGGGGKGMHIAHNQEELPLVLEKSAREAKTYFANGEVYIEKYFSKPRHIEVQILADNHGNILHLYDRECSVQRRFQKIIEEAPSPGISKKQRQAILNDAVRIARELAYLNAGTIEFLMDEEGQHYFLEVNTRIQVEHGITEMITGVDIVEQQIRIAENRSLDPKMYDIKISGHALEARIYAENPDKDFQPSPGKINICYWPTLLDTRIETNSESGAYILFDFDPMIAKLISSGRSRNSAIEKMDDLLKLSVIQGVETNQSFLRNIINHPDFRKNLISTHFVDENMEKLCRTDAPTRQDRILFGMAGTYLSFFTLPEEPSSKTISLGYWRISKSLSFLIDGYQDSFEIESNKADNFSVVYKKRCIELANIQLEPEYLEFEINGSKNRIYYSWDRENRSIYLSCSGKSYTFRRKDFLSARRNTKTQFNTGERLKKLPAPLHGKIIKLEAVQGSRISKGDILLVIESMKMENEIRLPYDVEIATVPVVEGQTVNEGDVLMEFV